MFSDTITVTINAVAKVLNRVNQDSYGSEYFLRESTGQFRLKLRNTQYVDKTRGGIKVDRHNIELTETVFAVAPATQPTVRKYYSVLENDQADNVASSAKFAAGITGFQTEANFTKLINWES
nr:MAG: hypothetical protein 2 [Leviviridae sp.]